MDRLWAPWRLHYVAEGDSDGDRPGPPKGENFILWADGQDPADDRRNLVVDRVGTAIVLLNRYPYNNGHLLVAPRREVGDLVDLTDAELLDCQRQLQRMTVAMRTLMSPDGFNVGLNLGRAAGAGLPQHVHWHLVPRWNGDTNFMTLMSDMRVVAQSLDEFWRQLTDLLRAEPAE